jgi:hypothetical protein
MVVASDLVLPLSLPVPSRASSCPTSCQALILLHAAVVGWNTAWAVYPDSGGEERMAREGDPGFHAWDDV